MCIIWTCDSFKILAKSPVFNTMFEKRWTAVAECQVVRVTDVEATVFKHFLRFIYRGIVKAPFGVLIKMVQVADKYEVLDLKEECVQQLMLAINPSQVKQIYKVAALHGCPTLLARATQYLKVYVNFF